MCQVLCRDNDKIKYTPRKYTVTAIFEKYTDYYSPVFLVVFGERLVHQLHHLALVLGLRRNALRTLSLLHTARAAIVRIFALAAATAERKDALEFVQVALELGDLFVFAAQCTLQVCDVSVPLLNGVHVSLQLFEMSMTFRIFGGYFCVSLSSS